MVLSESRRFEWGWMDRFQWKRLKNGDYQVHLADKVKVSKFDSKSGAFGASPPTSGWVNPCTTLTVPHLHLFIWFLG